MSNPARYSLGPAGFACLAVNYLLTRLLYHKARLIRFPFYCRGRAFMRLGAGLTLGRSCRFDAWTLGGEPSYDDRFKIIIEDNVQIGDRAQIAVAHRLRIGSNTLIASNVFITDHDHGIATTGSISQNPINRELSFSTVSIGKSCWIGQNACILKGVLLGDNCIVAAGAVVTRSFPAFSVIGGVPAKLLKTLPQPH
jgi:acetyltransferase-like isoleucine patch superfamily enzyme